ncbi:MAG: hypothetical protein QOH93_2236, partial [Chloroflexia bacterium]|nr:hypothetical protein [Chloroflexia bacterium]
PTLWGTEERLRELFGDSISSLTVTRRAFTFRYLSAEHWIEFWREYYGPTLRAFAALDEAGKESLAHNMSELAARFNRSGSEKMMVPGEYLEVVAIKK